MPQIHDVSVIIALSDHSMLPKIVDALAKQDYKQGGFETIVVDSATNNFWSAVNSKIDPDNRQRCQLQCHTIAAGGRGAALNEGIRLATGGLYIFLADDFIPTSSWMSEHVALHQSSQRSETVGLGPAQFSAHLASDPFSKWLDETGTIFGANFSLPESEGIPPTWFYGANTSIRPSLIWRAGLFDEDFPHDAGDDCELGARLIQLGMKVTYLPDAIAFHDHAITLEERMRQTIIGGESAAIADAKYSFGKFPKKNLNWNLLVSNFQCNFWKAAQKLVATDAVKQRYWQACLNKSHLVGYSDAWNKIVASGKPQRKLSAVIQSWLEEAIQVGVMNWDSCTDLSKGLYPFSKPDGQIELVQAEDAQSMSFKNPMGGPWAYFRIDPLFTQYLNNSIELTCKVYTPRATKIWIEYDSSDLDILVVPEAPGAFKRTRRQKVNQGWSTSTFKIYDLTCQERINGGDFRIGCNLEVAESFQVQSVEVKRRKSKNSASIKPFEWLERIGFLPEETPRVSIIIPVHNCLLYTLQCLQSIALHSCETTYEVIVVDDASTDETEEALSGIPGLRLIRLDENLGFTGACNQGAEAARGELLLFLNNDTVAMTGWLDEMVDAFDAVDDAGVIGSRLIYPQTGQVQHNGVGFDDRFMPYHFVDEGHCESEQNHITRPVPAVTGACFLTPRKLFDQLERFDPIYTSEFQDIDYCMKVESSGLRCYCCSRSVLLHYESVTRREFELELPQDLIRFHSKWMPSQKAA